MRILVNCSNLKAGGGLQVADSICRSLSRYPLHHFVLVLSSQMQRTAGKLNGVPNVSVVHFDVRNSVSTVLFGRDPFLDRIVENERIDAVLTVFGPSRWNPRVMHLSGFARAQLVCPESPFYSQMAWWRKGWSHLSNRLIAYLFRRSAHLFYAETAVVSQRVEQLFPGVKCYTVTNTYNQIFDDPSRWNEIPLPVFQGFTLLNVGSNYPHKNLGITVEVARLLKKLRPGVKFRFVLTLDHRQFHVPEDVADVFFLVGKVDVSQCPSLYQQADIMFQPTLLECFSATYVEAMKMGVPVVTTDLPFARDICGEAALYYSPLDPLEAAQCILRVCDDGSLREDLADKGRSRLPLFDNWESRADKLIGIIEKEYKQQ